MTLTLTRAVVVVWTIVKTDIPQSCITNLQEKLAAMAAAGQTAGTPYWGSPQISEYRFTDQAAAEEFVGYLTSVFPCNTDIDSMVINNL